MDSVNSKTTKNEEMTQEEKLAQVYDGTNPEVLPEYIRRLLTHSSEDTEIDELRKRFEGKTVNKIVNDMIYGPQQVAAIRRRIGLMTDLVYNGRTGIDDAVLPDRLRTMLEILPPNPAQRLRDWLTGYDIDRLERDTDYILGHNLGLRPPPPDPQPPRVIEEVEPITPVDLWAQAKEEVKHIAAMFTELKEVNMPDELAMRIIDQHVPAAVCQTHAEMRADPGLHHMIRTAGLTIEPATDARQPPVSLDGLGSHFGSTIVGSPGDGSFPDGY